MREKLFDQLKYCKLPGMIESFDRIHKEAKEEDLSYIEFFQRLVDVNVNHEIPKGAADVFLDLNPNYVRAWRGFMRPAQGCACIQWGSSTPRTP